MGEERFGRYKVTGRLGSGAMGHVYAAVDDVLGREVAVKTLHGRTAGLGARILDERFRLEARAIAALTHPSIVQVYDIDLGAEPPYLVMERVAGPSLKERFARGPLPANEVRALGIQIGRALAAAHAAGIVHRDVKPANILIAGDGTWKLVDFGVAHVPDSSLTMTGQFIGSPAYAPPEALIRGQSTAAGDVFGLGATLYFAAAGTWPRADATSGALLAPVPSLRELAPNLADDLIATIDRCVALEPEQRPTAAELAAVLAGTQARTPSAPPIAAVFVPDATADSTPSATVQARPPSPIADTHFVPDATHPAVRPSTPRRGGIRWRPWAIGAGSLLLLVIVISVVNGRSNPSAAAVGSEARPASAIGSEPAPPSSEDPPPGQIRVVTPPITDRRAAKEWGKLVDKLYEHEFDEARDRLAEWERTWGETEETRSLRRQLDAIPREMTEN